MLLVSQEKIHRKYMDLCRLLARDYTKGIGKPLVGAIVLADNGTILGRGHKRFIPGTNLTMHAERVALQEAGVFQKPKILYTTLEPCFCRCERKYQIFPSCAKLILERGIEEVVFALYDQSKQVNSGNGARFLLRNGIKVTRYPKLNNQIVSELMPYQFRQNYSVWYEQELDRRLAKI